MKYFLIISLTISLTGCSSRDVVELRKFPYPYRAALTICSDIDQTATIDEFLTVQRYLDDTGETPFGKGLGLEIGNSYWYYNQSMEPLNTEEVNYNDTSLIQFISNPDSGISLFHGLSDSLNDYADVLLTLLESGFIDCLHSYGHFNYGGFNISMVEKAITLHNDILPVDVFIDHEGARNEHNIGLNAAFIGDNPSSNVYHTKISTKAGIKFFWQGHVTHCVGQDGNQTVKNILKNIIEYFQDLFDSKNNYPHNNNLVNIIKMDDGQNIFEFVRFINPWGKFSQADEDYIGLQLNSDVLDELTENEGYLIHYTHLGKHESDEYLCSKTIEALNDIAYRFTKGDLFITTTSRILNYNVNHKYLNWHYDQQDDSVTIVIESIENDVDGKYIPTIDELTGITFYVPDNSKVAIRINNDYINFQSNPMDYTGRQSIAIPWNKLEFPELKL